MSEQVDLDALEALAKAATPGPWEADDNMPFSAELQGIFAPNEKRYVVKADWDQQPENYKDAVFIAAADPSTILALIAELRQALHDLEIMKEADWSRGIAAEARADELRIELRRERERADDLYAANVGLVDAVYATDAALSRAEKTIDRIRTLEPLWHRGMYGCPQDMYGANQIRAILTEYDKQKEVDRD